MKISGFKETSIECSKTTSQIARQLGLAGIAIIWIFKSEQKGIVVLDAFLFFPLFTLVLALIVDLFQYFFAARTWTKFYTGEERKVIAKRKEDPNCDSDPDVKAPGKHFRRIQRIYHTKLGLLGISYLLLIIYLIRHMELK